MQTRRFGNTDLFVTPITIGAWQLGGPVHFDGQPDGHPDPGAENVHNMIRALAGLGVNAIDTAEQYGKGESERRVGKAIAPDRDRWVLSTKFGYRVNPDGTRDDNSAPQTIQSSIEGSLKRLNTDRIDLLLYHCPPSPANDYAELDEAKQVLEAAKQAGKIRYYGISGNDPALLGELADRDMLHGAQIPHNLLQPATESLKVAEQAEAGVQIRGAMAGGRLSGRYFKQRPALNPDDNRSNYPDEDYARYAALAEAIPNDHTPAQAAIRWILSDPRCHTICMGAKNLADYEAIIQAINKPAPAPGKWQELEQAAASIQNNRA